MASSGKPRTTRAKLQREATLRERRFEKAARKEIRKQAQLDPGQLDEADPLYEADPDAEDPLYEADPDAEDGTADSSAAAPEAEASVGP